MTPMNLLAIELSGVDRSAVLGDERFENLRRLVEVGTFGPLDGNVADFDEILDSAHERKAVTAANRDIAAIDGDVGSVLESVGDGTVVLVLASGGPGGDSWFVLASPGVVPAGETESVDTKKLASLVAEVLARRAAPDAEDDDEALIRERFSGLGYIS
jgi:hypothetical protein